MYRLTAIALLALTAGCGRSASVRTEARNEVRPEANAIPFLSERKTSHALPHPDELDIVDAIERTGGRVVLSKPAGRVLAVDLSSCSETYHDLIDKLAALPDLEHLDLGATSVQDAWMEEVTACKKLRRLSLRRTELTAEGLKQLAKLPRLRELDVGHTRVTAEGLRYLDELTQLERLHLAGIAMNKTGMAQLGELKRLRSLALTDCSLTTEALEGLARLTELRQLHLGGAMITVRDEVHVLNAEVRKLGTDELAYLAALSRLESLDLSRVAITDEGLRHLAGLSRLKPSTSEADGKTPRP